ncbi:MAG: hypothetical protein ABFD75_12280 [Smithella sp.]
MKGDRIKYKEGYKYQLVETYSVFVGIMNVVCRTDYILLHAGNLIISKGYAWDGASGPTFDTPDTMRGSLVHDALYQLMRLGLLPESYREQADKLLHDICIEDGMSDFRADLWRAVVEDFASFAAEKGTEQPILIAP